MASGSLLLESEYRKTIDDKKTDPKINFINMWMSVNQQMDAVLKANPEVRMIDYCVNHILMIQVDANSIETIRPRLRMPQLWWTCTIKINAYTVAQLY